MSAYCMIYPCLDGTYIVYEFNCCPLCGSTMLGRP